MEDYKFLIYIALSILYFLFKNTGKKDKAVTRRKAKPNQPQQAESRTKTFQEILAELSGQELPKENEYQPEEADYNDASSLPKAKERPLHQEVDAETYNNADSTLKELYEKGQKLKTINELVDIEAVPTKSQFSAYQTENKENGLAVEILEDLQDPEKVKKAFIYSEIFTRKY